MEQSLVTKTAKHLHILLARGWPPNATVAERAPRQAAHQVTCSAALKLVGPQVHHKTGAPLRRACSIDHVTKARRILATEVLVKAEAEVNGLRPRLAIIHRPLFANVVGEVPKGNVVCNDRTAIAGHAHGQYDGLTLKQRRVGKGSKEVLVAAATAARRGGQASPRLSGPSLLEGKEDAIGVQIDQVLQR